MLRTTDRYVLREVLPPFGLALFVLTFLLLIPPIMSVAEKLIAKGVDSMTILRLMGTLIPQGLGITIPVALLLGILMGLGRMSADRESVAFQACGVSLYRLLYPLAVVACVAGGATWYVLAIALPDANQAFREITFRKLASRAEGEVKARVFDEYFPNVVLYVREVSSAGDGWSEVFLADSRGSLQPDVYVADQGQVVLDEEARRVDIVLTNGSGHHVDPLQPVTYEVHDFERTVIGLDPNEVFPLVGPQRGLREMSVPQLRNEIDRLNSLGLSPHDPIMEIQQKYSIPAACLIFTVIGLALGVTSRRDGKLASFALGGGVVFAYYIIMYGARALAKAHLVAPQLAMWLPNVILGVVGVSLLVWRSRSVERPISLPFFPSDGPQTTPSGDEQKTNTRFPAVRTPGVGVNILDWYVTKVYLGVTGLAFIGLLGIFYISTFIDLSDKLFKGQTTGQLLLQYLWFATPQFSYFVLPIAALVATLVTVGLLTKSSELTVMKACGISLYRATFPILLMSLVWSALLFGMSESILARANRRAEALNHEIRVGAPRTVDVVNRRWMVGETGSIYHFMSFDAEHDEFENLSRYEFHGTPWRLDRRTFAEQASYDAGDEAWHGRNVWVRRFDGLAPAGVERFTEANARVLRFPELPDYFETAPRDAELMNVRELDSYVRELRASGFDVVELVVDWHRKISFPFVTLILTLIAVPFAVTMGPRGALYGIGVGIALACAYWILMSVFGAIGSAGMLAPVLAAWAPNLLFGASATYLLLTVRT